MCLNIRLKIILGVVMVVSCDCQYETAPSFSVYDDRYHARVIRVQRKW